MRAEVKERYLQAMTLDSRLRWNDERMKGETGGRGSGLDAQCGVVGLDGTSHSSSRPLRTARTTSSCFDLTLSLFWMP